MNLKELRLSKGHTQVVVANALGIKQHSYSGWESGIAVPSREKILTLAGFFGISADEMFKVFEETKIAGEKAQEEKNALTLQPTKEPERVYNLIFHGFGKTTVDATIREIELDIKKDFEDVKRSFFKIGYKLYIIDKTEMFKQSGFDNIIDYAQTVFGIGKTTTYNLISVYDNFKAKYGSPEIGEVWQKYSYSQLSAMTSGWCLDSLPNYVQKSDTVEDIKKFIAIWNRSYRVNQCSPEGNTLREVLYNYEQKKLASKVDKEPEDDDVGEETFVQSEREESIEKSLEVANEQSKPFPAFYETKKQITTPGRIRQTVKTFLEENRYDMVLKNFFSIDDFVKKMTEYIVLNFEEIFQSEDFKVVTDAKT